MNMTTLLYGDLGLIRDEFVNEVSQVHYRVSDMARDWRDVAADLRISAAAMVTALCMSTAREFRILQRDYDQTLIVWAKGPEGWAMSADEVEYARSFRERGKAWEELAAILVRGEKESVRNWPGNQVEDLREAGLLDGIIDDLSEPGTVMVLDSSEPMVSSPGAFTLLFGGDGEDWGGI